MAGSQRPTANRGRNTWTADCERLQHCVCTKNKENWGGGGSDEVVSGCVGMIQLCGLSPTVNPCFYSLPRHVGVFLSTCLPVTDTKLWLTLTKALKHLGSTTSNRRFHQRGAAEPRGRGVSRGEGRHGEQSGLSVTDASGCEGATPVRSLADLKQPSRPASPSFSITVISLGLRLFLSLSASLSPSLMMLFLSSLDQLMF